MKKLEKAAIAIMLGSTLFVTGVSFAQQNQNQNGNGNRRGNNRNGGNMNGNMMMNGNSNMMMNGNSNMMMGGNSNQMMMNGNMSMGSGMMQSNAMIGNLSIDEFNRLNAQGGAAVAAITPTSAKLSSGDQKLMTEVAMGGMRQLEVSRAALSKVQSENARVLAQSEVDEQTALGAKLREIASAKGVTLPSAPDAKTTSMVAKMNAMAAGMDFDKMYIKASGVDGHKKLDKTMTKVAQKATDADLKAVEAAAHPLVRTHLQVSQAELDKMNGKGMRGGSMEGGSNSNRGGNSNSNR